MHEKPHVVRMQTGSGSIEVCSQCQVPVPPKSSYEDASGRIWARVVCPVCNTVFKMDGPFRTHGEANPKVFK